MDNLSYSHFSFNFYETRYAINAYDEDSEIWEEEFDTMRDQYFRVLTPISIFLITQSNSQ